MDDPRLAGLADARRIAEVHVAARRSAYEGLIPAEQLAAERVDDREARWTRRLSDPEGRCWLAHDGGALVGFAYTAPTGDEDLPAETAEVYGMYLLPRAIGRGIGRELLSHALSDVADRGFRDVVLWYAEGNHRAARFYTAAGFAPDPRVPPEPFGITGLTRRRLHRLLSLVAVVVVTCLASGCAEEHAEPTVPSWTVAAEPELSIGAVEGDSAYLFQRVVGAARAGDGRVVVADGGLAVVRVFDADGGFLVQMGRAGDGPGEFGRLTALWLGAGDTLGTWDAGHRRLTWFALDGEMTRSASVTPGLDAATDGALESYVGTFTDGTVALARIAVGTPEPGSPSPDRMTVERFDRDGGYAGRIATFFGLERVPGTPIPFSRFPYFALHDDVVHFTNGGDARVTRWHRDGRPLDAIDFPSSEHDVDAALVAVESELRARDDQFQLPRLPEMPRPESMPDIAGLLVDPAGRIWTKRYEPSTDALWLTGGTRLAGGSWWVASRDGALIAVAEVPDGVVPLSIGADRLVGLTVDGLGVERVTVHRIGR